MGILVAGLIIAVVWFFIQRNQQLDKDRDQHHLASMLISVAAGQNEVSRDGIAAFLEVRQQRQARLNHALRLAKGSVSGEAYDRVVELARSFSR